MTLISVYNIVYFTLKYFTHILAHLAALVHALVPEDLGGVTEEEQSSRWSEVSRRIKHSRGKLGKLTDVERINIATQVRQERELQLSVGRVGFFHRLQKNAITAEQRTRE